MYGVNTRHMQQVVYLYTDKSMKLKNNQFRIRKITFYQT